MERDTYKFRSKARVVAFVDLIFSSMALCLYLILCIGLLRFTSIVNGDEQSKIRNKFIGKTNLGSLESDLNDNKEELGPMKETPSMIVPNKAFVTIMWVFLALTSILMGIQILAAVRLLNATQIGKDPAGSMKLCRFWRRVCMFFTGLLIFNFLTSFRQRGDNFFGVSFILTCILIRIVALYIVQQFVNELDVALTTGSLPIHRNQPHVHIPPMMAQGTAGDNIAYGLDPPTYPMSMASHHLNKPFDPPPQYPMPSQAVPPPKYEDVVKEPYKFEEA